MENARARQGDDAQSLALIDEASTGQIRRLVLACHGRLGSPLADSELEEAVQDTLIALWRRGATFQGRSSRSAWVYGIARLAILDRVRVRQRHHSSMIRIAVALDPKDATAMRTPVDTAFRILLRAQLTRKGTTEALIIERRLVERSTFGQIANAVGMNESAVKARFLRALPAARERLQRFWDML